MKSLNNKHQAIVSCSNYVFPTPTDWNENIHQYGYWFVEEKLDYTPSKELANFLAAGEKPIYFGFGSVFNNSEKDVVIEIIISCLKQCGKRGIICGMGEVDNLPDNIIAIGNIPHSWLFKRCLAVCHHGGAGTTAAVFQAGIPGIIIPYSNDQFAWAHRAYDLGVASKPIYRKNLSSDNLSKAITFTLNEDIRKNAEKLAQNIATENGALKCAIKILSIP